MQKLLRNYQKIISMISSKEHVNLFAQY